MRPEEVFRRLREYPLEATQNWGFVIRSNHPSGPCTVTCRPHRGSEVYELVIAPGGPDWYCQFQQDQALDVLVPFGQPNGTMVVTFGMNGCSLEVREEGSGNRFYHDSDGQHLPAGHGQKFRANYGDYAGPNDEAAATFGQLAQTGRYGGNFEHTVICIKRGLGWDVFNTAVVSVTNVDDMMFSAWQVKGTVPNYLGSFPDVRSTVVREARRDLQRSPSLFPHNESPI